jgi:hypothetical protein
MATAPAPPAPTAPVDLAKLASDYIALRAAKTERRKAWETEEAKYDAALERIEGVMLNHLNTHNMDSVRTDGGTFYRQEDIKPNIVDDKLFFEWIKENNAFDAMQRRVSVTFVKEFMESHEGGLPPPGLNVSREYVVRVRKPQ